MISSPAPPRQHWQFGRIYPPDEAWLATAAPEPIIEPELPIVDPHHHLWLRGGHRYLLDELLADIDTGHNVVATVFLECHSMYRADGPPELRSLGETEFVAGIAAMSESGNYGNTSVAAGIVGNVDLTLGDRAEPVLLAHIRAGGGRFRGVRHSAGYDADPVDRQQRLRRRAAPLCPAGFPRRPETPQRARPELRRLALSPAACRRHRSGARFSGDADRDGPCRWVSRLRPLCRPARRGIRGLENLDDRTGALPQCRRQARRHGQSRRRLRFPQRRDPALLRDDRRDLASVCRDLHRIVRRRSLHVRKQLPGRQDGDRLRGAVERLQAHRVRRLGRTKSGRCSPAPPREFTGSEMLHERARSRPFTMAAFALGRRRPDRRRQSADRRAPARGAALGANRPPLRSEPRDRRRRAVSAAEPDAVSAVDLGLVPRFDQAPPQRPARQTMPAPISNGSR